MELAVAGNTEVVRAKRKTVKSLGFDQDIEDILITLSSHYHLIRPLKSDMALFLYLALDRNSANLGLARAQLRKLEEKMVLDL